MKKTRHSKIAFTFFCLLAMAGGASAIMVINPHVTPGDYLREGAVFMWAKDGRKAFDLFDKAVALDPKAPVALNARGTALTAMGDQDKALADFTAALALDPKYAETLDNRGMAHDLKGEHDPAIDDYNAALALCTAENYLKANILFHR